MKLTTEELYSVWWTMTDNLQVQEKQLSDWIDNHMEIETIEEQKKYIRHMKTALRKIKIEIMSD